MKKLEKRWQIYLYGCAGLGINMLNLIVGSYLCSALLIGGFEENVENWTYINKDLVVAGMWSVFVLIAKIVDGVIDIPLSTFADKLKTRWGRRRPALILGFVPMIVAYLLFLVPLNSGATILNTIWFAVLLCIYYSMYTLTMLTYYATFSEIFVNERDRITVSNIKSVCDVAYFVLGYALVPALVSMGMNIRIVALVFLPLSLTVLIPLFLIKEESTKNAVFAEKVKSVNFIRVFAFACKNTGFIKWMVVYAMMNMGLQLFLSGINEFFSSTGLNMTFIMASVFMPVPLTLILYNYITKKKGIVFGLQYCLLVFSVGMGLMIFCDMISENTGKLIYAIVCAVITSFAIGAFFSVTYSIPSQLADEETKKTGVEVATMYFAIQGLFGGVAAGIAQGPILVALKQNDWIHYLTIVVAIACMTAFALAFLLPKNVKDQGKEKK
ncbi:MAG: MFS transporter [Lachnospiraceae bacterium]|nr:MFS transporter [Lachnospiraceae bacterium]